MKLKPEKLKIGQKYFLIDYDNDVVVVVEGIFYKHDLYGGREGYDFKHSITIDEDGDERYDSISLNLIDGVLKQDISDRTGSTLQIENRIFSTREEAEAKKNKYILKSLKAIKKVILRELKENSESIKKIKGE